MIVPIAANVVPNIPGKSMPSAPPAGRRIVGASIDTTLEDLALLNVNGVPVPIYVVGVGENIHVDELSTMAEANGGAYFPVAGHDDLLDVLPEIASYGTSAAHVCVDVLHPECGPAFVQITIQNDVGGVLVEHVSVHETEFCPALPDIVPPPPPPGGGGDPPPPPPPEPPPLPPPLPLPPLPPLPPPGP